LTIVIEAIPRYPPQRVLRAAVIPRGGTGRASLNFHTKRDATVPGALSCTEGRKNAGYPVEQRQAKKSG
jgi:hypothetical protein